MGASQKLPYQFPWGKHVLTLENQKVIQRHYSRIEKDLDVRAVSRALISEKVLDCDQMQEINSKNTSKAANTVLANHLHQHVDMLECFLKVLESDEAHPKHRALAKDMREYLAQLLVG